MSLIEVQAGGSIGLQTQPFYAGIESVRLPRPRNSARPRQERTPPETGLATRMRLRGLLALLVIDAAASLAAPGAALFLTGKEAPAAPVLIRGILFLATMALMGLGGAYRLRVARAPLGHAAQLLATLAGAHLLMLGQLWLAAPDHPPALPWAAAGFAVAAGLTLAGRASLAVWWRNRARAAARRPHRPRHRLCAELRWPALEP